MISALEEKYRFGVPFGKQCGHAMQCQAGISKLIMRWDGVFFPCEAFKESDPDEFRLGRLGETSLSEMLGKAKAHKSLLRLKEQSRGIDPCPAQYLHLMNSR